MFDDKKLRGTAAFDVLQKELGQERPGRRGGSYGAWLDMSKREIWVWLKVPRYEKMTHWYSLEWIADKTEDQIEEVAGQFCQVLSDAFGKALIGGMVVRSCEEEGRREGE